MDPQKSLFLICLGKALIGVKLFLPMKKSKSEGDCVQKFLQVTSLETKLKDFFIFMPVLR